MRKLALVALALAAGCRSLPFPDPQLEGEYGKALKKWTRSVTLYSGLETRAFARIVYLSPDFVESQARELSKLRAELPDQAAQTLEKMRQDYRQPSFFAVVYMPDKTANDWNQSDSVWRIALNLGFGEGGPDKVVRFEVPFNAELRALYPYLDEYSTAYQIRFPEPAAPRQSPGSTPISFTPTEAQLVIAGALGQMKFHWRLDGGPEEPSTGTAPAELKAPGTPKP